MTKWISGLVLFTSDRGITPPRRPNWPTTTASPPSTSPSTPTSPPAATPHTPPPGMSLPDDRYMRTLDPWVALAPPARSPPACGSPPPWPSPSNTTPSPWPKSIATLDHLSGGRVTLGVGHGWNTDELAGPQRPPARRRTMLREYLEAMNALWTDEVAEYHGEFVDFGPSWAWPKPIQSHIPSSSAPPAPRRTSHGSPALADGWITTPATCHRRPPSNSCTTPGPAPTATAPHHRRPGLQTRPRQTGSTGKTSASPGSPLRPP